ncbi:MAG: hypothetical protein GXY08_08930, partial [Ruminococcus sp.]|nr:hypothetical protein [Ruminococcus sp.]
ISWRLNNAAAKQVMYRRPAGSDKDTPWEKVEISGYYSDHGYYTFNMDSTNTWGKYECFIRAWDNVEKWANEDVGVHYVGEKDYVDSEIFIVEMRGSDDTPGIYCIDSFKADGTYPEQEGMIFAGWYEDPEHTKPYKGDTGYAFAKFIDKDCLSIKWQVPVDFADKDTTDIRLISSLDCGKYNSMHLVLKFAESGSEIIDGTITRLYDTLNGYVDQENVAYVPEDVFCEDSHYFAAFTVTGMPKALYTTELVAYAYIVTEDGTTVYGDELNFRVSDDVNYHE